MTQKPILQDKSVLVTGGTGSLGQVLVRRMLSGAHGLPRKVVVFSRDEAKQHAMRLAYQHKKVATDEVIFKDYEQVLEFRIGDVRDYHSVCAALKKADVVINAAALKQVPTCEYFPYEAALTNVTGAENIVRAVREHDFPVQTVVGVSTDKAAKPVNVMGMTKALQERVFIAGNLSAPQCRFVCVRYGNVLASRGSVIPLFHEQLRAGGPLTVTTPDMTRFLLSLEDAVDTIMAALEFAKPGETFIPRAPSSRMTHVAQALIGDRPIEIVYTGIRPGEKVHEILVSEEEAWRTYEAGRYLAIRPMLPEIAGAPTDARGLEREYSSADDVLTREETAALLARNDLLVGEGVLAQGEMLR